MHSGPSRDGTGAVDSTQARVLHNECRMQFKSYLLARACHVEDVHMLLKQLTAAEDLVCWVPVAPQDIKYIN